MLMVTDSALTGWDAVALFAGALFCAATTDAATTKPMQA
jgi:hypothetical protein